MLSLGTLLLTLTCYLFIAPTWIFPIIIVFYINILFMFLYHQKSETNSNSGAPQSDISFTQQDLDDLGMAKRVQQALLSAEAPVHPAINITRRCIQAKHLGGDFYTFINKAFSHSVQKTNIPGVMSYVDQKENHIGFTVGDVAGHGVSSALVMALSSALFDKVATTHTSPSEVMNKANNDIQKFIENSHISHLTAFYGSINLTTKELSYSCGGHPAAILLRKDKTVKELTTNGVFLGIYKDEQYEEAKIQLQEGDRLFVFTDGILEASNPEGDYFGTERFVKIVTENQSSPIDRVLDIVFNAVKTFSPNQENKDDQTMIIIDIL